MADENKPKFFTVEVPKDLDAEHALVSFVVQRWNEAVAHRNTMQAGEGGISLAAELELCRRQFFALDKHTYDTYDKKNVYVNFAKFKTKVLKSVIEEFMFPTGEAPFTVAPTPLPELSEEDLLEITQQLGEMLLSMPGPLGGVSLSSILTRLHDEDELVQDTARQEHNHITMLLKEAARGLKVKYREQVENRAQEAASNMNVLIHDQLEEGDFKARAQGFATEICIYPFAVMLGPVPVARNSWKYQGNEFVNTVKIVPEFFSGSVHDTFWSPDSTTTQDGTYVLVRSHLTREQIQAMLEMPKSYNADAVRKVLARLNAQSNSPLIPEDQRVLDLAKQLDQYNARAKRFLPRFSPGTTYLRGPAPFVDPISPSNSIHIPQADHLPPNARPFVNRLYNGMCPTWTTTPPSETGLPGAPIDAVTYYGKITGRELLQNGYTTNSSGKPIEEHLQYETEVLVVMPYVLRVFIYEYPFAMLRPVHTANPSTIDAGIIGDALPSAYRGLEKQYNTLKMLGHNNDYLRSAKISLVNQQLLTSSMREQILELAAKGLPFIPTPGMVFPVTDSVSGMGRMSPIEMVTLAENMGDIPMALNALAAEIDRISGIPASMHGEPVGSGANRTFRGMSMLAQFAARVLRVLAANIDSGIFSQIGLALYYYNMLYSNDDSVKGDCMIIAKGAQGAVDREVEMQQALEQFGTVSQVMGMMEGIADPEARAMVEAAVTMSVVTLLSSQGFDKGKMNMLTQDILARRMEQEAMQEQQAMMQQQAMVEQQAVTQAPTQEVAADVSGQPLAEGDIIQ